MPMLRDRLLFAAAVLLLSVAAAPPPDVALTDETGRTVRFHSDLARGRTVAVNFIFTSCTTICLPMSGVFARVESLLGERDARLISVTLDPETDTPQRLAEWKKKFGGGASWTLLTGAEADIDALGKALGVFTPDRVSHAPMVVVVNGVNGRTTRVNGLASAQAILDGIDSVASTAGERGSAIYSAGPPGDVTIGDTTMSVAMPCTGCHGADGRGRTEGGVTAPDITWEALTRRGYDARRVVRAVAHGIGGDGRTLATPMPRYRLARSDAADLVAFLRRLGTGRQPGISDDAIRIGVLVPEAEREAIVAWAEDVNRRGGIYARRLEVRFDVEDVFVAIGAGDAAQEVPVVPAGDPRRASSLVEETLRRAGAALTRETFVTTMKSVLASLDHDRRTRR